MDLLNVSNNNISFGNHLGMRIYEKEDFITIPLKLLLINDSTNIMHKVLSRRNQVNTFHIN